ncbi:NAD(P)-binding domain-containing protein [Kitasatospora purpeofusca]|uniref:NAD(P)-binding domain-containing protein n=1 Tax=Kitasatospora purpeofusca TaxID=67352 RepID=UPI00225817D3|nr:NAD(P)-binding domain-containing protein [Kitasatospora purpeofusca]MCX4756619.1 lysine N(6)-hydroxylase/L-ornithine N(5)-oxygenase family protein [Kitasatospora purpeofusca]WSR35584.1 lysine N(6)-hydroxylase/L-ornithine N(5)-oxygenase family protein [Kitasatospora purpeofusca]WSR43902.1 lysine N(6)-hydroxylase/L-ornithine N(5)-oxygenase family protein [Kitasatospora purpeofusca]
MTTPHTVPVAVVGAGPYGLAVAAHLAGRGLPPRVLGVPMESWRTRMPAGMFLKSLPRASSISDPAGRYRLADFRAASGLPPAGDRYAVPLDEFVRYGEWFQRARVPQVERASVVGIERARDGFRLTLDTGEVFAARAVVLAGGFPPYARIPEVLRPLVEAGLASHTVDHADLAKFGGRRVAVIGAGQSALESATLLHEAGAEPVLVARTGKLLFGEPPDFDDPADRPWPVRLAKPGSPLGPGWSFTAFSRATGAFRALPDATRARLVRTVLGPAGGWWLRERLEGRFPVLTGHQLLAAERTGGDGGADGGDGGVRLGLRGTVSGATGGTTSELEADHVLAATGYRVDVGRLDYLSPELRGAIERRNGGAPRLSAGFESSVPGLYFTGLSAADTFGPLMRFVCGTGFAARRISRSAAAGPAGSR